MNKRDKQLEDYLEEQTIQNRIEFINNEIRNLDDERFYLITKLFHINNKKAAYDDDVS